MIKAAGILYAAENGQALFLKRGDDSDYPGAWCFPGGHIEAGETSEQAAERESEEELGRKIDGDRILWTRTVSVPSLEAPEPIDFTTYLQRVEKTFEPMINGEHVGWAWAPIDQPPQPLHPGAQIALDKFGMTELELAYAIRDGRLTSPQRFENVALFDIRVSGTGVAYRPALNEYVYRRPANYLTDEFLARCNGLPVVIEHPEEDVLNTKEFSQRVIGAVFVPYIKGDEVWAIAKIYDTAAARAMEQKQLSTSPGVVFRGAGINITLEMEDGKTLLIEGKPTLLDHLAICEVGVWDKGGDPAGVVSAEITGESAMTEEERIAAEGKARKDAEDMKDDTARKDAAALGEKLDKFLTHVDSFHAKLDSVGKRMDSFEERFKKDSEGEKDEKKDAKKDDMEAACDADEKKDAKKDAGDDGEEFGEAKRVAADKGRKDAEDKEDDKKEEKMDRKDSATQDDIRRLEAMIARPMSDADFREMAGIQAKADRVFEAFGDSAPRPLQGESKINYRVRLANALKVHSPSLKEAKLDRTAYADSTVFEHLETQIYKDALDVARSPSTVPAGQLRMVTKRLDSGHIVNEFVGEPAAWMSAFSPERQYVTRFNDSSLGSKQ